MSLKHNLKKYFLPHKTNDHKPHFLRLGSFVGALAIVLVLFVATVSSHFVLQSSNLTALVLPKVLVDYANQDRQSAQYKQLAVNSTLEAAAQLKANDMASKGYFAHNSPDGHTPWYWFEKAGYDFSYAGENLAVNFSDSVDVNTAWMNSPGHRANIMNSHFTEIGIATADGFYQGRPTTFVVQLFGTPAEPVPVVTAPTKTQSNTTLKNPLAKKPIPTKPILSTIASSSVLGVSDVNSMYIAVENKTAAVSGASTNTHYSNWFEKVLVSPRRLLSFSYLIIALLIIISLIFTIRHQVKKHHPYLIVSASVTLLVILVLLYIYYSALFTPLLIV